MVGRRARTSVTVGRRRSRGSRRLRRLDRRLNPRTTRAARHPHALVVCTAAEVTALSVLKEERVEPGAAARSPHRHGDLDTGVVVAVRRIIRPCVVTAARRLLWWFREARAVAAQLGPFALGLVTRDDDGERSAAEEAGSTLRYGRHLRCLSPWLRPSPDRRGKPTLRTHRTLLKRAQDATREDQLPDRFQRLIAAYAEMRRCTRFTRRAASNGAKIREQIGRSLREQSRRVAIGHQHHHPAAGCTDLRRR